MNDRVALCLLEVNLSNCLLTVTTSLLYQLVNVKRSQLVSAAPVKKTMITNN